jgi:hypothetical protein
MMRAPSLPGRSICALWLAASLAASGQQALRIEIVEGADAVVPAQALSARRFAVVVKNSAGAPAAGVTVHFRLPAQGPSGAFASGLRTESTVTGPKGEAAVYGIRWGAEAGKSEIQVAAVSGELRAETSIPVEISAAAKPAREDRANPAYRSNGGSKKWVILLAAGAAAAAGIAASSGKGGSAPTYAPPAAVVVTPTIGTPTITIGKP